MEIKPDIVYMKFGSHLYGLDTPKSDIDYKGIYMPSLGNLLLGNVAHNIITSTGDPNAKNAAGDIDIEIISLPKFIKEACNGETYALDMLHSKEEGNPIWSFLVANRRQFYCKDMRSYIGYVKQQAAKYGIKGSRLHDIKCAIESLKNLKVEPSVTLNDVADDSNSLYRGEFAKFVKYTGKGAGATEQLFYEVNGKKYQTTNTVEYVIEQLTKMYDSYGARAKAAEANEGIDWKAITHALRAGYQARDIYKDGDFEYPLKETNFLREVKAGTLNYKQDVSPVLEELVEEVYKLSENSKLPEKVNRKRWAEWLLLTYREYFNIDIMDPIGSITYNV